MAERKYTQEHEWVLAEGDEVLVGVTEYAAAELGDVVFLELPEPGDAVEQGASVGTIETVKSVEDLYSPVSGEVTEVNEDVLNAPETVNRSPLDEGWLFKVRMSNPDELDGLLDEDGYGDLIGS
jgi:glycine cleavage system H protein